MLLPYIALLAAAAFAEPGRDLDAALRLREAGRFDEAARLLLPLSRREGAGRRARAELAWTYLAAGRFTKARPLFEALEAEGELDARERLGLARALLETGAQARAAAALEKLIEQRPRLAHAWELLGQAQEALGESEKAAESYREALKRDSFAAEVRARRAGLLEKLGRHEDAWTEYARVAAVDAGHPGARAALERLKPLLSRPPEEIIPPRRLERHSRPPVPAEPGPEIRVGLATGSKGTPLPLKSVSLRPSDPYAAHAEGGRSARLGTEETWTVRSRAGHPGEGELVTPDGAVALAFSGTLMLSSEQPGGTLIVGALEHGPGMPWSGRADRELRGRLELRAEGGQLVLVNRVSLEEYVYGVLPGEMPTSWPHEALKAQAVIARTQGVYRSRFSRPHRGLPYDVCDGQHCQVYAGAAVENERGRRAVDDTRGKIMEWNGRPAHTVFFSNCGGHTRTGGEAGWGDEPYWAARPDAAALPGGSSIAALVEWLSSEPASPCGGREHGGPSDFRWMRAIPASELERRLRPKIGPLRALVVEQRSAAGHVRRLRAVGAAGSTVVEKEHELRRLFGVAALRSTLFVVEPLYRQGRAEAFLLTGGGWGHGVGLCQTGAAGRAHAGDGYESILGHYYPGAALKAPAPKESL